MKKISFVIPAYNEEGNLKILSEKIISQLNSSYDYEIIFVDDGSKDKTLEVLKSLHSINSKINFLSFSKNFGHQHALKAGIDNSNADCVIMMDADLQHPPELISLMVDKWDNENYDVVYTSRNDKKDVSFFKRITSVGFYKIMNNVSDIAIDPGSADFRLVDRKIVDVISKLKDPYLFLRGLIPWMGFRQYKIEYTPDKRYSGKTKYSTKRMMKFAINGITSFSVRPLHIATLTGSIISILSFIYAVYAVVVYFVNDQAISGWASLLTSVLFIGGIQLLMIGIIGEYVGKIYMHLKNRPTYIIKESSKS